MNRMFSKMQDQIDQQKKEIKQLQQVAQIDQDFEEDLKSKSDYSEWNIKKKVENCTQKCYVHSKELGYRKY